jgi:hypothetical protein
MAKILLQTTIVDIPDDWNVERLSFLAEELRRASHKVRSRNRDPAKVDSMLGTLDSLREDLLWLMSVDTGASHLLVDLDLPTGRARVERLGVTQ